jgi:hypothetical protein
MKTPKLMVERRSSKRGLTVMPVLGAVVLALLSTPGFAARAPSRAVTPFQCEKQFHTQQRRASCFSQLPGTDCAHPIEAEKAGNTTRGEHQYFKLGFHEEPDATGAQQYYSYKGINSNVGICPHGATYKVSLLSDTEHCEGRPNNGHMEEYCSSEYDTKNLPEPSDIRGGSFTYHVTSQPRESWYLVIKGYFIHPPWAGRG